MPKNPAPRPLVSSVPSNSAGFIPPHGGYKNLRSYQKALIVYDATLHFCRRFISPKDRTFDQIVQAPARAQPHCGRKLRNLQKRHRTP